MGAAIDLSEKDKPKRMFSAGFSNCRPRDRFKDAKNYSPSKSKEISRVSGWL